LIVWCYIRVWLWCAHRYTVTIFRNFHEIIIIVIVTRHPVALGDIIGVKLPFSIWLDSYLVY
jgi:hypothetical protein